MLQKHRPSDADGTHYEELKPKSSYLFTQNEILSILQSFSQTIIDDNVLKPQCIIYGDIWDN